MASPKNKKSKMRKRQRVAQLEKAIWEKPRWHGSLDAAHHSGAGRNMNQIGG